MRSIEFSEHLRQHFLEIKVVVDMRQELPVGVVIALPVYAVDVCDIELLVYLFPDVFEDVLALQCRLVLEISTVGYGFLLAASCGDL